MQLSLSLFALLALLTSSALASFFDSNSFDDDDSFGIGGVGGSGLSGFGNDDLFGDNTKWREVKPKKGDPNSKYYVKSYSSLKTKGYPKKEKKILNDQKKWSGKGDGKKDDGANKEKEVKEKLKDGKEKKKGDDNPFGKGFEDSLGLD